MRQDKERSIREQADLWKGYWCILACILLVGRVSYLTFFQNHIVSVYAAAQTEQKEDSSVQILQENLMEEIQIDDVQKEKERRSNIEFDENGAHRKKTQYRAKLKISEDGSITIEQEPD